ncbi:alanine transporter [Lachnoclostridium sp. An169]|uniref:MBOAT family O-acyltransferase n=1 Tax=Lachnoclostridium sp. An169 TaxID=1965569 RepID=UPI000B3B07A0|nr:MBOAT family O-acyltransferase [Lachnoclostridium sp. An169]OUP85829.1 alanine transporter [Lachnoclostridium sp. An169]
MTTFQLILYILIFLPLCLLFYRLTPQKHRWKALLGFSIIFYLMLCRELSLILYLAGAVLITHYIGIWLAWLQSEEQREIRESADSAGKSREKEIRSRYRTRARGVLAFGVLLLLSILAGLKYYNFLIRTLSEILNGAGLSSSLSEIRILLPLGISFYTLQAIGYMADVYWGRIKAEPSLAKTALFLMFFPQIIEGPICRHSDTAEMLYAGKTPERTDFTAGYIRIFWGLFKKLVIADRLALLVSQVFDDYRDYSGVVVAVSAVAYTIQLYMEFSGFIDIVIGSGRLFGIRLPENFRQPFCSQSAAEFWRRWHITLGVWFKSYIFYPVSVSGTVKRWNQYGRKHAGKYLTRLVTSALALFPVWLCNGLWHGDRWSYIFYGMYYFTLIILGTAIEPVRDRVLSACHISADSIWLRSFRILKTWLIIFTGELFFRADGLKAGIHMFRSIFRDFDIGNLWDGTLLNLGMSPADFAAVIAGCIIVAAVGHIREHSGSISTRIAGSSLPLRWGVCYALLFALLLFAAYGDGYQAIDLIYAGF